jgi:hypothetical protein
MMIGGYDIIVDLVPQPGDAGVILDRMRGIWPGGYFQEADAGIYAPIDTEGLLTVVPHDEFFLYRDKEAFDSWERDGLTPTNGDTMIYVLLGKGMTFVVDARESVTAGIVADLVAALRRSRSPAKPWDLNGPNRGHTCIFEPAPTNGKRTGTT